MCGFFGQKAKVRIPLRRQFAMENTDVIGTLQVIDRSVQIVAEKIPKSISPLAALS